MDTDSDRTTGFSSGTERVAVEGWYPDEQTRGYERYWDGRAWTTEVRPIGAPKPLNTTGIVIVTLGVTILVISVLALLFGA